MENVIVGQVFFVLYDKGTVLVLGNARTVYGYGQKSNRLAKKKVSSVNFKELKDSMVDKTDYAG